MMWDDFIEVISLKRELFLKTCFICFLLVGVCTVILRVFYIPPELKEIYIFREYLISFMMVYFLNEWAKLQDSPRTETER